MCLDSITSTFLDLCHLIHAKGLVSGSGGNVSMRWGDQILITPSGRSLESLQGDDLVFLHSDGCFRCKDGGKPSQEWRMHLACYQRRDVNVVVHVHSTHAVAIACSLDADPDYAIPVYTPGYCVRVGRLPILPYAMAGSMELANQVGQVIQSRNSVMLANHGILTVGATVEAALNLTEEIEDEAKLHLLLGGHGRPLTQEQQEALRGGYH